MSDALLAPFPYFGGKRSVVVDVWQRLGRPKQYIEPFCGSCAMLLGSPAPASLEVVGDASAFIANFWRATKHQPAAVAEWADYPVSHIDLGARHKWLVEHKSDLDALHDADWPGDAKIAGWWLWGQCCWIGSGWCEKSASDRIPMLAQQGKGIQAFGKIPHASNAGRGYDALLTTGGRTAWVWLHKLTERLERVRIVHGAWDRCLNAHFGGDETAYFLDPPYRAYEKLYAEATPVADAVAAWARENERYRVALCGHKGDYEMPGWTIFEWKRGSKTYASSKTTDEECIWFSPACIRIDVRQTSLFGAPEP